MKISVVITLLGTLLSALPFIHGLDAVTCTLILHVASVTLCAILAGELSPTTIIWGSLAGLAGLALWSMSPALSAAMMMMLLFAPRSLREPGALSTLIHGGAAFSTGLLAGSLLQALQGWIGAGPEVPLALGVVSGAVAASPWLLPVDDALTHRLRTQAMEAPDALRHVLTNALRLRLRTREILDTLPRTLRRDLEHGWRELARHVDVRLDHRGAADALLDLDIHARVTALERAYVGAQKWQALQGGPPRNAHARVALHAETFDAQSEAFAEVEPALVDGK